MKIIQISLIFKLILSFSGIIFNCRIDNLSFQAFEESPSSNQTYSKLVAKYAPQKTLPCSVRVQVDIPKGYSSKRFLFWRFIIPKIFYLKGHYSEDFIPKGHYFEVKHFGIKIICNYDPSEYWTVPALSHLGPALPFLFLNTLHNIKCQIKRYMF